MNMLLPLLISALSTFYPATVTTSRNPLLGLTPSGTHGGPILRPASGTHGGPILRPASGTHGGPILRPHIAASGTHGGPIL